MCPNIDADVPVTVHGTNQRNEAATWTGHPRYDGTATDSIVITYDWWWLPGSEVTIEWTLTNWIVGRSEQKTLTVTLPGAAVQDGARKYLDVNCGADRPGQAGRLVFECPDIDASEPVEVRGVDQDGRRVVWTGSAMTSRAGIPVVYTDEVLWQSDQELRWTSPQAPGPDPREPRRTWILGSGGP